MLVHLIAQLMILPPRIMDSNERLFRFKQNTTRHLTLENPCTRNTTIYWLRIDETLSRQPRRPEHFLTIQHSGHLVVGSVRATWQAGLGHNSDTRLRTCGRSGRIWTLHEMAPPDLSSQIQFPAAPTEQHSAESFEFRFPCCLVVLAVLWWFGHKRCSEIANNGAR